MSIQLLNIENEKIFLLWVYLLLASCNHSNCAYLKTIAKREICSGNSCNPCDGRSCNSCNNNVCCSSVNCNKCVTQCSNQCNTVSCNNNCVSGCANSCQNSNCAVSSCSQCINKCSTGCSTDQCVDNCCKSCDCTSKEANESIVVIPSAEPSQVIVNNTNNNAINLTTHVNINNVVHNINNISIPVYVNTTNINNINLSEENTLQSGNGSTSVNPVMIPVPYYPPFPQPYPQPYPDNCCYVLHPRTCYTDELGDRRCYIRRSRECSEGCTSPVISIEEQSTANKGCQRIGTWPYIYCGNYVRRDCDQCYTCEGIYNPSECSRQKECSENCRRAAPNCVPSQSGLQCY